MTTVDSVTALRDMADQIDRGPTFSLPPSVIAALVRERADELEALAALPRTWTLPAEPGPEVKALRDEDGTIWRPVLDAFSGSIMWSMQGVVLWSFLDLLVEHGPLTDATGKAPE